MDTSKIITGVISARGYTTTAPIVKEDYGLYLKIEGVELPEAYEVDFSNDEHNGTSVTMIGNADGVLIPSQYISTGKDIFAFLYHVGEDFGRTVYKFRIPNKVRPDRTEEQPTPEEQSVIDQTIDALNEAVESAQENADFLRNATATATSLSPDSEATVTLNEGEFAFGIPKGAKGDTPTITTSKTGKTTSIYVDGSEIAQIEDGTNGDDGYSPTANVTKSGKTATITITDKNGTTSAQVEDGTDGTDGVSPTVSVTDITGGHKVTFTDKSGTKTFDVMDGDDYALTEQDKQDIADMVNVPVDDVQINGQSIVENGVANVPIASADELGAVKINAASRGIGINSSGVLGVYAAGNNTIKSGSNEYLPIVPQYQHSATFYGLAKSAGDTSQSQSSNAVGNYTEDAKSKIQDMIGIDEWKLVAEETLAEDGYFDITIANSAREVYIYAEIEIASGTTSLVVEADSDSGTRAYYQTFGGQISSTKKAITVVQLIPIATEIKALAYFGKDVSTNSGHFDWQHKSFNVGKLNRFRITAYGGNILIPTGSIVRIFAR